MGQYSNSFCKNQLKTGFFYLLIHFAMYTAVFFLVSTRDLKIRCTVRSVNNLFLMEQYGSKGKKGSLIIIYN